jgi:hypothetical protein
MGQRRGNQNTDLIIKDLDALGHTAGARTIARILECSKPTVMK